MAVKVRHSGNWVEVAALVDQVYHLVLLLFGLVQKMLFQVVGYYVMVLMELQI